ncbi:MAG TPA: 4'-phosphopantetheinyl transferase superfamily protein [Longimicrobiales bacterium]
MEWSLQDGELHVWRVALDEISPSIEMRSACLSPDERTRATLYTAPLEQRRFITSRIVQRHVLAAYHGVPAVELPLAREPGGRPFIEGAERLFFSLSHSAGTAVIAVADIPVGVDVERVRRIARAAAIARRVLHPDTVAALSMLPATERDRAFLDAWTQREAHVKAVGGGLFQTPDALPFDPAQPADASVRGIISREDGALWSAARFLPYPYARAAVVAPGGIRRIRIVDWHDLEPDRD